MTVEFGENIFNFIQNISNFTICFALGITRQMIVIIEDEKLIFFIENIIYGDSLDCYFMSKRVQICCICGIKIEIF